MCLFMFAGCKPKTIEAAIKPADLQKMVDEMKENSLFKSYYSDADIKVSGNTITYEYWYKNEMDDDQIEAVKEQLEKSNLESQIPTLKDSIKQSYGVAEVEKISIEYYTKSGKHIVTISG